MTQHRHCRSMLHAEAVGHPGPASDPAKKLGSSVQVYERPEGRAERATRSSRPPRWVEWGGLRLLMIFSEAPSPSPSSSSSSSSEEKMSRLLCTRNHCEEKKERREEVCDQPVHTRAGEMLNRTCPESLAGKLLCVSRLFHHVYTTYLGISEIPLLNLAAVCFKRGHIEVPKHREYQCRVKHCTSLFYAHPHPQITPQHPVSSGNFLHHVFALKVNILVAFEAAELITQD